MSEAEDHRAAEIDRLRVAELNRLRTYYDAEAVRRDQGGIQDWKQRERQRFVDAVGQRHASAVSTAAPPHVLELGAGPGRDAQHFIEECGFSVSCVDLSLEMVAKCRQRGLTAECADFTAGLAGVAADSTCDAVFAMNSVLHVPKATLACLLEDVARVLKPGGVCFIGLYGGDSFEGRWDADPSGERRFFAYYTDAELRTALGHADLFDITHFGRVDPGKTRGDGDAAYHFQSVLLLRRDGALAAVAGVEEVEEVDGGEDWQSLPHCIFDDLALVPTGCTAFMLPTGGGGDGVTVAPHRAAFERREHAASGDVQGTAVGVGADEERVTGALLWDAAVVMASYLVRNPHSMCSALPSEAPRCIELGAGLGLAGLTAASALGVATTLTDRRECVPMCAAGITTNALTSSCTACELEWGDDAAAQALGTFDLVLAADCVYEVSVVALLVQTIVAVRHPNGCVLVAYDEAIGRPAALAAFRERCAAAGLEWEELDTASHDDVPVTAQLAPMLKSSVRLVRLT